MLKYDDRQISKRVYLNLGKLSGDSVEEEKRREQRGQAVELYTYIATWGLLRLQGEDAALTKQPEKRKVVHCFFQTLGELITPEALQDQNANPFNSVESGLDHLTSLPSSEYLGLTGIALQIARKFSFWAEALYSDL